MRVYLDNAATTPLDPQVAQEMSRVMTTCYGNPSSIHSYGREARALIENARKTVARLLQVSPSEIFFTSGGTEANNTVLNCSVRDLGIKHVITSPTEHHAVLHTVEELQKRGHIRLSLVEIDKTGKIDLTHLESLLASSSEKTLVSLMEANNEIGTLLPMKKVSELCAKYNALFHSDTVQTMGHYQHHVPNLGLDFLSCSAHKFHGPKGIGFLYINGRVKISPFIFGGAQERNMRGGTENIYGIVGLAKAMELAYDNLEKDRAHIEGLKKMLIEGLKTSVPGIEFNGDYENGLYTVLNVSFPPSDFSEMLLFRLDIAGIAASGGSACSSGTDIGSHVLKALKCDSMRPAVRFSFSKFNTEEEIRFCLETIKELYAVEA